MENDGRSERRWRGGRGGGCGGGCASAIVVLTIGLILTIFNTALSIGVSARAPFTGSNLTIAGSVGKKGKVPDALPAYGHGKPGGNQNFINRSQTQTTCGAEGTAI